ncbi:MAG: DNA gyrase inhibitor YacG [Mariprofundaceae bacterium]
MTETPVFRCPACKKSVARQSSQFPFCSERCRLTDLGKWASEDYCIASEEATPWEVGNGDE